MKLNKLILILSVIGITFGVGLWQVAKETNAFKLPFEITNLPLAEMPLTIFMALFVQQIILIKPSSKVAIFIENTTGNMAKFSYSLYLSHRIVLMWIFGFWFQKEHAI